MVRDILLMTLQEPYKQLISLPRGRGPWDWEALGANSSLGKGDCKEPSVLTARPSEGKRGEPNKQCSLQIDGDE
jgi:hypothetical protein